MSSTLDFNKEDEIIENTLNNIAVIVGVLNNATLCEIKVSLNKAKSTYTVWKTINKPKHTYTFIDKELPDLASTMAAFDQALLKAGYVLSTIERWVIELRLSNEVEDIVDVVFFGERHPEMTMYGNNTYACKVSWGWDLGMRGSWTTSRTLLIEGTDKIEYRMLDSFLIEEDRVLRLFQLKHPDCLQARFLIRNCSIESEPTAAESISAMANTLQIFAVAYRDQTFAWKKYMQVTLGYVFRKQLACSAGNR